MSRILFVANGHGETAIAARIAADVRHVAGPSLELDLFPLVGTGAGAGTLAIVGPRAVMPSGGLVAMGNVRAFARDVRAGFLPLLGRQLAFLREARARYDAIVAVGDAYALALALVARRPAFFVGTAKSAYVAPYGPFERTLLRRARAAFVRDQPTAEALRRCGVAARAPGNVIVDLVGDDDAHLPPGIGLFPGSRAEAYADGVRLARAMRALAALRPGVRAHVSIAPTLDAERFARSLANDGWNVRDGADREPFAAESGGAELRAWTGSIGAFLGASTIVVGQAGTANEQAAAMGVPVVALGSGGRREAWYRMRQRRLLGDALAIVPSDPMRAAAAIDALLGDAAGLERMRAAGRERMGGRGGALAVARAVVEAI